MHVVKLFSLDMDTTLKGERPEPIEYTKYTILLIFDMLPIPEIARLPGSTKAAV